MGVDRYIVLQKIIELGGFTKAADALGFTQSAVSQMISSLEDELGMKLLTRSRTGVGLTAEGTQLYPFIERSILAYRAMLEKSKEIMGLETGVIRVGTVSSVTCHWLPGLIKGFRQMYPKVQFVFHQGDYNSITEWVKTGEVDFGFVNPTAARGLNTVEIKTGRMLAVLPHGHPLAEGSTAKLSELCREPYILLEEGDYSEPLEAFGAVGVEPDIRYVMHDDYAIMTMVEAGLGVSILAELVLRRVAYNIVCLPTEPPVLRTLAVAYKDKAALPVASKRFIDYIRANAERLY